MNMDRKARERRRQTESELETGTSIAWLDDEEFRRLSGPKRAWLEFRRNRFALVGAAFIIFIALMGIFAPIVSTHDPYAQSLRKRIDRKSVV